MIYEIERDFDKKREREKRKKKSVVGNINVVYLSKFPIFLFFSLSFLPVGEYTDRYRVCSTFKVVQLASFSFFHDEKIFL